MTSKHIRSYLGAKIWIKLADKKVFIHCSRVKCSKIQEKIQYNGYLDCWGYLFSILICRVKFSWEEISIKKNRIIAQTDPLASQKLAHHQIQEWKTRPSPKLKVNQIIDLLIFSPPDNISYGEVFLPLHIQSSNNNQGMLQRQTKNDIIYICCKSYINMILSFIITDRTRIPGDLPTTAIHYNRLQNTAVPFACKLNTADIHPFSLETFGFPKLATISTADCCLFAWNLRLGVSEACIGSGGRFYGGFWFCIRLEHMAETEYF